MNGHSQGVDIRTIDKETAPFIERFDPQLNTRLGFLHIPKTGGSSIVDFLTNISYKTVSRPAILFHSWNMDLIREYFPDMKIICLIRDPLERTISGFQSRLRMGQPKYMQPWRSEEAAAFSIFGDVESFLDALLMDDEFSRSATDYALRNIISLSWNYQHYFGGFDKVNQFSPNIAFVQDLKNMDQFIDYLVDECIVLDPGVSREQIKSLYEPSHVSSRSSSLILKKYGANDISLMKKRLSCEYLIYGSLLTAGGINQRDGE